jgi:D-alanyl-D-alanine dipeptidase
MKPLHQIVYAVYLMGALGPGCNAEPPHDVTTPTAGSMPGPIRPRIDSSTAKPAPLEQRLIDSGLVDVGAYVQGLRVDLKYSSTDNFIQEDVYGALQRCYLRPEAAQKLKKAQELLQREHPGWSLLIYDGVRPHHIQALMWEKLDIPFKRNYLAPPWEGSVHNYGCAVDLTLTDHTGAPLDMGTPFDFFGKEAQPQLEAGLLAQGKLTETQVENRKLLRRIMKQAGFYDIQTEWWHFNAVSNAAVRKKYTRIP